MLSVILFVWLAGALGVSLWFWSLDVPFNPWALPWIAAWPLLLAIIIVAAICRRLDE